MAAKKKAPKKRKRSPAAKRLGSRQLVSLHGAADLDTPEKRLAVAEQVADDVIDAIESDRKARGLPPLDP